MLKPLLTLMILVATTAEAASFACRSDASLPALAVGAPSIRFNLKAQASAEGVELVLSEVSIKSPRETRALNGSLRSGTVAVASLAQGVECESEDDAVNLTVDEKAAEKMLAGKAFKATALFSAAHLMSTTAERTIICQRL